MFIAFLLDAGGRSRQKQRLQRCTVVHRSGGVAALCLQSARTKAPSAVLEKELAALQARIGGDCSLLCQKPCNARRMFVRESTSTRLRSDLWSTSWSLHSFRLLLSLADFENNKKRFSKEREDSVDCPCRLHIAAGRIQKHLEQDRRKSSMANFATEMIKAWKLHDSSACRSDIKAEQGLRPVRCFCC